MNVMEFQINVGGVDAVVSTYEGTRQRWVTPKQGRGWTERARSTGVYVWESGETVLENLALRTSRPVDVYRAFATEAMAKLDPSVRLRWDRKCGCSMCPCSPGFRVVKRDADGKLVRVSLTADGFVAGLLPWAERFDVSITIGERLTDPNTPEAQFRAEQLGLVLT